ncbi:GTP-binding protein yptV5 [Pelomyxa schiedti]|nr:GTP-binding protein yptV5 [Pelomyxa schiedti]
MATTTGGVGRGARRRVLKVILLGNPGVGKTALLAQFLTNKFTTVYKATIGADFHAKDMYIDGKNCTLQVWDTAGQERFQSLGSAFYRGTDCCALVFDVNVQRTFDDLNMWHLEFITQSEPADPVTFPFVLIGNKIDTAEQRLITQKQAQDWCASKGDIPYIETSAKSSHNVREAFELITRKALKHEDETTLTMPAVNLDDSRIDLHSPQQPLHSTASTSTESQPPTTTSPSSSLSAVSNYCSC